MKHLFLLSILTVGIFFNGSAKKINKNVEWTSPIKATTFNIQYPKKDGTDPWCDRLEPTIRLIKTYDFDIIGIQEPYLHQVRDLMNGLPQYAMTGLCITGKTDTGNKHFNPIFYKKDRFELLDSGIFWFSSTPDSVFSKGWDAYSVRVCNWAYFKDKKTQKKFYHFNSHFDHLGIDARVESAKLLLSKLNEIAKGEPAFVTGDFNSNQTTDTYKTLASSTLLYDSYTLSPLCVNKEWPSYNGYKFIETAPANAKRIDHIFVTRNNCKIQYWELINKDYNKKYPSDHFPIMVELCFKK